jgi:hypothetical protein
MAGQGCRGWILWRKVGIAIASAGFCVATLLRAVAGCGQNPEIDRDNDSHFRYDHASLCLSPYLDSMIASLS